MASTATVSDWPSVKAIARMHGGGAFAASTGGQTTIGFTIGGGRP